MCSSARGAMVAVALTVGLVGCGAQGHNPQPAGTLTAYARSAAANDSFSGRIAHATGHLSGDENTVKIDLQVAGGSGTRKLTVALISPTCGSRRRCLALAGTLKGSLVSRSGLPDRGRTFSIRASGKVKPLGRTSATGTVTGTGNIRLGRESLTLTLTSRAGAVVLDAQSGQVPGFTSP